jgi:hypothetical protein
MVASTEFSCASEATELDEVRGVPYQPKTMLYHCRGRLPELQEGLYCSASFDGDWTVKIVCLGYDREFVKQIVQLRCDGHHTPFLEADKASIRKPR